MPFRPLRTRNSTKLAEERGDAVPWPLPATCTSLPLKNAAQLRQPLTTGSNPGSIGDHKVPDSGTTAINFFPPFGTFAFKAPMFTSPSVNKQDASQSHFGQLCPLNSTFVQSSPMQSELMPSGMFLPLPPPPLMPAKPFRPPPVGVFWDIENCHVPRGKSALIAVQRIREKFFNRFLEADFVCVCDIRKESSVIIQELNDAQVSVNHVAGNSKNAADDKLRQAMRRFSDVYTSLAPPDAPPAAIILISGDINFATDLSDLRYRKRMYVILLHNRHAPEALLLCANEHYDFHMLLGDLPNRPIPHDDFDERRDIPFKGGHCPVDVIVTELPLTKNVNKVKLRLKKLSDNCGGKVTSIQGQFALVRFPNHESAVRATKRMTGEDVFGSKIRVHYSSQMRMPLVENKLEKKLEPIAVARSDPLTLPSHVLKYESVEKPAVSSDSGSNDDSDLKKYVVDLLQEIPNHSLPLFKFKEMFERRYGKGISDYDLYRLRDVVCISESSGYSSSSSDSSSSSSGRIISLCKDLLQVEKPREVPLMCASATDGDSFPMILSSLKTFSARVHYLTGSHKTPVVFSSFLESYESSYGPLEVPDGGSGVPFEHLVSCVEGVDISVDDNGLKQVEIKDSSDLKVLPRGTPQPNAIQITQLSRELTDLITCSQRCCLPYSRLLPAYLRRYNRQLKASDLGFPSLWSLIKTLSENVQIIGQDLNRVLTLTHRAQMKRFTMDVLRILKAEGPTKVKEFDTRFNQVFPKRKFAPEDYGLCYLNDLILELVKGSSLVAVIEDGEGNLVLTIPARSSTSDVNAATSDLSTLSLSK